MKKANDCMKQASVKRPRTKDFSLLLSEIMKTIPNKDTLLVDVEEYRNKDVRSLPAFNEDGSVAFYDIGGVLLGRSALIKFIEQCR